MAAEARHDVPAGLACARSRRVTSASKRVLGTQVDTVELVGAYEVNADCTGRSSLNVPGVPYPIECSFVIVGNGRQVKAAVTSPKPNIVTALLDRM